MKAATRPAPVVTIDGPSGSGKGTIAFMLAERLGWHLLDSGALYRLVAFSALRRGLDFDDEAAMACLAMNLNCTFLPGEREHPVRILLDGQPVGEELRTEVCAAGASRVAAQPAVRQALLARQWAFRRPPGLVADGRDMGTVVFPDAELKVFLTASARERAIRRHNQLKEKGLNDSLARLEADIASRDERDARRAISPLRPASDAVVIDTTGQDVDHVFARVHALVVDRGLLPLAR